MLKFNTNEQLQQLALDQTPIYKSAMIGFSHPLSDKLQVSADATVVNLTQPIVPIGLDPTLAALPAGNEYYYAAQLIGNNIVTDGDMYIGAIRYSQMAASNLYVLDFNTRIPATPDLRISPRLRLGYMTGHGTPLTEYTVLPSILVDYQWTKNLSLEFEVGVQWTNTLQPGIKVRIPNSWQRSDYVTISIATATASRLTRRASLEHLPRLRCAGTALVPMAAIVPP